MKIHVIYGTVGGNTKLVCESAADVWSCAGHEVKFFDVKSSEAENSVAGDVLVFASPTYGHGELEPHFERFLRGLENVDLKDKKCAIIGLGDPKYDKDYHLESIKIISDFLGEKGAAVLHMPLRISKNPLPLIEQDFVKRWAQKVLEALEQ